MNTLINDIIYVMSYIYDIEYMLLHIYHKLICIIANIICYISYDISCHNKCTYIKYN